MFRFCNPNRFRSVLALVFKGDDDFTHRDCHVLGFSAFGEIRAWSERYGALDIDLPAARVACAALAPTDFKNFGNIALPKVSFTDDSLVRSMIPFDQEDVDYQDFSGKPMYRACVKSHGVLEADECYGFFPALAISGEGSKFQGVDKIRRVKAIEHFVLLAQIAPFTLVKIGSRGFETVRAIG